MTWAVWAVFVLGFYAGGGHDVGVKKVHVACRDEAACEAIAAHGLESRRLQALWITTADGSLLPGSYRWFQ